MSVQFPTLSQLGWRPGFSQHLTLQDFEAGYPARVTDVQHGGMSVLSSRGATVLPLPPGVALTIGALRWTQTLTVTVLADPAALPDLSPVRERLAALDQLPTPADDPATVERPA